MDILLRRYRDGKLGEGEDRARLLNALQQYRERLRRHVEPLLALQHEWADQRRALERLHMRSQLLNLLRRVLEPTIQAADLIRRLEEMTEADYSGMAAGDDRL